MSNKPIRIQLTNKRQKARETPVICRGCKSKHLIGREKILLCYVRTHCVGSKHNKCQLKFIFVISERGVGFSFRFRVCVNKVCITAIKNFQFSHNTSDYYMASSASGQDDPNRALWLATRAGKMEPSCPLGTTRCIPQAKFPQKPYNKSFIDQVCSVKMAGY